MTEHDEQASLTGEEDAGSLGTTYSRATCLAACEASPGSFYARLYEFELLQRVTDIVLAKTAAPAQLHIPLTKSIHDAWRSLPVRPELPRVQVGFRAYMAVKDGVRAEAEGWASGMRLPLGANPGGPWVEPPCDRGPACGCSDYRELSLEASRRWHAGFQAAQAHRRDTAAQTDPTRT